MPQSLEEQNIFDRHLLETQSNHLKTTPIIFIPGLHIFFFVFLETFENYRKSKKSIFSFSSDHDPWIQIYSGSRVNSVIPDFWWWFSSFRESILVDVRCHEDLDRSALLNSQNYMSEISVGSCYLLTHTTHSQEHSGASGVSAYNLRKIFRTNTSKWSVGIGIFWAGIEIRDNKFE